MSLDRIVLAPIERDPPILERLVTRARRRGFQRFLVSSTPTTLGPPPEEWYLREVDRIRRVSPKERTENDSLGEFGLYPVSGPEELEPIVTNLRQGRPVLVHWLKERVIPLETLVAARSKAGTLWVLTHRVDEVPAILGALESGADTAVVEVRSESEIDALEAIVDRVSIALPWELVPLRRVVPAGSGDRVIVDTTSLLRREEGMLVGSAAAFLFHVSSEAEGSRYTRPRPFRVNAGAAHSYVLLANGETRYLAELTPGDSVLVGSPGGAVRPVRVGRIKTERRPLVLVEAEREGRRYTIFLQEAETVRLTGASGRTPATELAPGTSVYGAALPAARHLGQPVSESIEER
jgi:3-dehydroquinate synthase II